MQKLVEYIIGGETYAKRHGPYRYILAKNGVWVAGENEHLSAVIPIAHCTVRGLEPWEPRLCLEHGRIPRWHFDLAISVFMACPEKEVYLAIVWDGSRYSLQKPEQKGSAGKVEYTSIANTVLDLHSHGKLGPGFSLQDDSDEQGFRLYGCVGGLYEDEPSVNIRVGVYGYWMAVPFESVFDGGPNGVIDVYGMDEVPGKRVRRCVTH